MTQAVVFLPTPTHTPTLLQDAQFFTPPASTPPEPLDSSMTEDVEMGYAWPDPSDPSDDKDEGSPPPTSKPTPPAASKTSKFRMGFVPDCAKCRDRVPGHYLHF